MKVTSLDVSNLLSFGEFHLDFDDRLTILVGPNGAGKTNIVRILDLVTKCQRSGNPAVQRSGVQVIQHPCVHVIPQS